MSADGSARLRTYGSYAGFGLLAFGLGWCWSPASSERSDASRDDSTHDTEPAGETWTCSMHPQIRREAPGDCPICGMDLVLTNNATPADHGETSAAPSTGVSLDPRAQLLAQIETITVRTGARGGRRQLLGRLEHDETRLRTVSARIAGRIERLLIAATGVEVKRRQRIAILYSPEVYAAHQDLRVSRRQMEALEAASDSARASAQSALEAARKRLELLGVSAEEVDRMAPEGQAATEVTIRSPVAGTVLERFVTEGQYVQTGDPLFRVADLSRLWVQLDAYETELAQLDVGARVRLHLPAQPQLRLEGRVSFVEPTVNPRTRVAEVRVEVDNPEGRLRPGMLVEASVEGQGGDEKHLVVPRSAVLFTGVRSLVYVERPDAPRPTYDPRVVELGPSTEETWVVRSGLQPGERVVVEGAFVLDADLQIRGGPSAMTRDDEDDPAWASLVRAYLAIQEALADDDLDAVRRAADSGVDVDRAADLFEGIEVASDLATARAAFEDLSDELLRMVDERGNPLSVPLRVTFCPMVGLDRGASWLQTQTEVDNPYFGAQMQTCGEFKDELGPGERR